MRQNNFPGLKYLPPLRFDRVNLKIYSYSILTGLVSGIVVVAYRASVGWIENTCGLRDSRANRCLPRQSRFGWVSASPAVGWQASW